MGDQHAALFGYSSQHWRIIGSDMTDVLHAHDVHAADAAQEAAHDVPIEILVSQQVDH